VLGLGVLFYAIAATTTFTGNQFKFARLDPVILIVESLAAGLASLGLGYVLMILVGGRLSLDIARGVCRVTGARQVIKATGGMSTSSANSLFQRAYFAYATLLVFAFSVGIGWDLFNADGPKASFLRPLIHALDVFARPVKVNAVAYSAGLLPVLLVLIILGGLVPAFALPYFRNFKVTGVNSPAFHIGALSTVGGFVIGLSVVLALVGLVYNALWVNKGPLSYHFTLLVLVGLSLHFALGTYIGRDRSERMIAGSLRNSHDSKFVFLGSVDLKPESTGS
jgi:hypothetical protein